MYLFDIMNFWSGFVVQSKVLYDFYHIFFIIIQLYLMN